MTGQSQLNHPTGDFDDLYQVDDYAEMRILISRYVQLLKLDNGRFLGDPVLTILSAYFSGVNYQKDPSGYTDAISSAIGFLFELRQCLENLSENGGHNGHQPNP